MPFVTGLFLLLLSAPNCTGLDVLGIVLISLLIYIDLFYPPVSHVVLLSGLQFEFQYPQGKCTVTVTVPCKFSIKLVQR